MADERKLTGARSAKLLPAPPIRTAPFLQSNCSYFAMMQELQDKFASQLDPWDDYLYGSALVVIGLVSAVGNGLTIRVFRDKGDKITVPEILLLHIAVINLLVAVVFCPLAAVSAFLHRWIYGPISCVVYGAVSYFLGLTMNFLLTALAVYRFVRLCCPTAEKRWIADRTNSVIILSVYAFSALWTAIPFYLDWEMYDVEPFGLACTLSLRNGDEAGKIYTLSATVFCAILPLLAIAASHVGILLKIRQSKGSSGTNNRNGAGKQIGKAEIQFIRVSFAVCIGFFLAWAPYCCLAIWTAFGDASLIPIWIKPIPLVLAKSSMAYNPIIYVLLTRRYRADFSNALREILHLSGPVDQNRIAIAPAAPPPSPAIVGKACGPSNNTLPSPY